MKAKRKIKFGRKAKRRISQFAFLGEITGVSKEQKNKLKAWLKKHNHNINSVPPGIIYRQNPNDKIGIRIYIYENEYGRKVITAECKFCGKRIDLTD
ncbi:MAG: hypothetical protein M1334_00540 [Patescibacteria group bacterium]|nr:hypothetical protein [Patescibacteria group bacterium]